MSAGGPGGSAAVRAADFVDHHGSDLDRLRARARTGAATSADVRAAVRSEQAADGSFDGFAGAAGPIAGALAALAALDGERGLRSRDVELTARWLAAQQREDGSWAPDAARSAEACVVPTGLLAGYLAKTPFVRSAVLAGAGDFLAARFDPDLLRGDFWAIAAFGHFFANWDHELGDGALQWCGRELERGFQGGRFDALHVARIFVLCDAHAMPGARIDRESLWLSVLGEQAADGGWLPALSPPERVSGTLDALLALERLGPKRPAAAQPPH